MDRLAFNINEWNPTEDEWTHLMSLIEPEERERINKFQRPGNPPLTGRLNADAKASLIGRLLIQHVAHHYCQIPHDQLKFGRTKEGKPYLISKSDKMPLFNFNISHSGAFVVCASEDEWLIGIDVMESKLPNNQTMEQFFATMKKCFTPNEWAAIRFDASIERPVNLFFIHWCLKEAYLKAIGIGLGFDLQRVQFALNEELHPTSATMFIDNVKQKDWKFVIQDDLEGHVCVSAVGPITQAVDSFKATMDMTKAKSTLKYPNIHVPVCQMHYLSDFLDGR